MLHHTFFRTFTNSVKVIGLKPSDMPIEKSPNDKEIPLVDPVASVLLVVSGSKITSAKVFPSVACRSIRLNFLTQYL